MGGIRDSIGGSNGSATQEAGPVGVSLVAGTVVAASEVDGAEVGDGIDVGSAGRVAVGVGLGICTPHPATSTTDRTDNESATLRIAVSLSKNEGIFYHKATNSATMTALIIQDSVRQSFHRDSAYWGNYPVLMTGVRQGKGDRQHTWRPERGENWVHRRTGACRQIIGRQLERMFYIAWGLGASAASAWHQRVQVGTFFSETKVGLGSRPFFVTTQQTIGGANAFRKKQLAGCFLADRIGKSTDLKIFDRINRINRIHKIELLEKSRKSCQKSDQGE